MLRRVFQFPPLAWKPSLLTLISTTLLIVDGYHQWLPHKAYDRLILYLVIPLLVTWFLFRESPREYGFRLGNWKLGLGITLAACALLTPVFWLVMRGDPSMQEYYSSRFSFPLPMPVMTFIELLGWEFFFRGWLLFGYYRVLGPHALWLQMVPFAMAHISKPEIETLATTLGGFAFGWVAWRTDSFLYPFLIHWYIFSLVIVLSGASLG